MRDEPLFFDEAGVKQLQKKKSWEKKTRASYYPGYILIFSVYHSCTSYFIVHQKKIMHNQKMGIKFCAPENPPPPKKKNANKKYIEYRIWP